MTKHWGIKREGWREASLPCYTLAMDTEERLKNFYPWLAFVARKMSSKHADDLIQVGALAAWQALLSFDGKSDSPEPWMKMKSVNRMKDYIMTTAGTRKGVKKPGWDLPIPDEDLAPNLPPHLDIPSDVRYHSQEIRKAIAELPEKQREYIYLRFWEDADHKTLEDHFGYNPTGLWYTSARLKLRDKLAHLKEMA